LRAIGRFISPADGDGDARKFFLPNGEMGMRAVYWKGKDHVEVSSVPDPTILNPRRIGIPYAADSYP